LRRFTPSAALSRDPLRLLTLCSLNRSPRIGLGLLLSMSLTRLVATQLYRTAWDPIAFAGGALLLFLIVVLATLVPAVRVMRVDPMTALRYE
jgi:ABC-type antimicrobial peptide transport system permease subunit